MDVAELKLRLDGLWTADRDERNAAMSHRINQLVREHAARGMLHSGNMLAAIKDSLQNEIKDGAKATFEILKATHQAMGSEVSAEIRSACHSWISNAIEEYSKKCATASDSYVRQYGGSLLNQSMLAETDISTVHIPLLSKYRLLADNYLDGAGNIGKPSRAENLDQNTSRVDSLTGLFNREAFDAELTKEVSLASERSESLAMIFVDVDHFKKVNDTHGHQKGDDVLKAVGQVLNDVVRGKGRAFRYGGEEMTVLLPNHSLNEAISVAERCRLKIEAAQPGGIAVTASLGIGVYPELSKTGEELLQIADKAMYDAKSRGRNLVRVHGEPEPAANDARREPEKKLQDGSRLTNAQMEKIRKDHFQRHAAICPDDQTPLRVHEINEAGRATPRLMISCPICGLNEVVG